MVQSLTKSWVLQHALIRDEDGTFVGGSGGSILARSEVFSEGSGFGFKYIAPINIPEEPWWYPNLPTVMRADKQGAPLNVSDAWLKGGYGLARKGCSLEPAWNAWRCPFATSERSYRRFVIENMDADNEIRRISPVALTSQRGYTDLLNGCMDHGWCMSYTCLKRLMTFWAVVKMETEYTVHFSGTTPQNIRLALPFTPPGEKLLVKIYYQSSLRLQIFVGKGRRLVEDMNLYEGVQKAQLVRDGKWSPNDGAGGYIAQKPSLDCACLIGDQCKDAGSCGTPSNVHGANRFNRRTGMHEVLITGHGIDDYVDIEGMPVVAVSMGVSTSVEDFYKVKGTFISTLAQLLGIPPSRIAIVDVVTGNARRRNLLSATTIVEFEIAPDPEISLQTTTTTVLESAGFILITVARTVNYNVPCSVEYRVNSTEGTSAVAGINFKAVS